MSVGWEPVTVWGQPINLLTVLHHSFCFPPLCHGFNFDIKSISIHAKSGNEAPHFSAVQRCWFAYKKKKSIWQIIIIPFFIHCPVYLTAALSSQGWNLTHCVKFKNGSCFLLFPEIISMFFFSLYAIFLNKKNQASIFFCSFANKQSNNVDQTHDLIVEVNRVKTLGCAYCYCFCPSTPPPPRKLQLELPWVCAQSLHWCFFI